MGLSQKRYIVLMSYVARIFLRSNVATEPVFTRESGRMVVCIDSGEEMLRFERKSKPASGGEK